MSKKNFTGGLSSLLGESKEQPKRGRPRTNDKRATKSTEDGTPDHHTRATFIVDIDLLAKVKSIAYWERKMIKDTINEALAAYVKDYEAKKGEVKPAPKS
jgi:hypothetical protein